MSGLPTIAIVDDDPGILRSIDSLIRSAGMTGTVFDCAEAFLEAPGHSHFDCLVTDVHMSGISGLDLREELMRRGSPPPTIIMTAFPTPRLTRTCAERWHWRVPDEACRSGRTAGDNYGSVERHEDNRDNAVSP
ncbi:response regulator transcription factor [Sphingomonas sp. H160509]|uniref:response regulator transcription factor n=1 Tax=Sphingomonas sp. H160509 TaxID=2955313 RepID=UPI00406D4152